MQYKQVGPPPRASPDWLSRPRLLRASPAEWVRTPELWTVEALLDAYAVRTFTVVDQARLDSIRFVIRLGSSLISIHHRR